MTSEKIFQDLYEILKRKGKSKMIVGITGFVGSGKTYFAKEFAEFLKKKGINSTSFNMDIYNSSTRAGRNAVIESLKEKYYPSWPRRAYPQNSELIKTHLSNIKKEKSFFAQNLCDPITKELNFSIEFLFNEDHVHIKLGNEEKKHDNKTHWVLCDGVKLVKYKKLLDCLIFLKAENQTRFNRLLERNNKLPSPANVRKDLFDDLEKNLFLDYNLDEKHAHIVIDNENFNNRKIIKQ